MKEKICCGIDIGSTKVAISLLGVARSSKEVIFNDLLEHQFVKDNLILDLSSARDLLKKILSKALKKVNRKFSSIFVNAEGVNVLEIVNSNAMMPLNDGRGKIISSSDVKKIDNHARALASELDKEIIHQIPQHYIIDNKARSLKAKGLFARKIGVDLLVARVNSVYLNNIYSLMNSIGFDIDGIIYTGEALKNVFLDKASVEKAANIIIDIGGNNIYISLYKDNILSDVICIPQGANVLIGKVSESLQLPFDLAFEILKSYGAAFSKDISDNESIVIKKTSQYQTIKRKDFVVLIEPEIKELLSKVKSALDENELIKNSAFNKTILAGRICLMDGFIELAEQILGTTVELGKSQEVEMSSQKFPSFAASIGLALCGAETHHKFSLFTSVNRASGFFGQLKEIYQDYF